MDTPNKLQLQGAAKVLSHQKQKLKEGRHNWALRCKWRLSRVLQVEILRRWKRTTKNYQKTY